MILCKLDENSRWTGETREVEDGSPCPPGWCIAAPPELGAGEEAEWWLGEWRITDEPVPTFEASPDVPAEVPMHKIWKAARLTPWPGHDHLKAAIEAAFDLLPAPKNDLAWDEWNRAQNLVREGATTKAVQALLGMTDEQRDDLVLFANSLP